MVAVDLDGNYALHTGDIVRPSEVTHDTQATEWYEDLRNSVGKAVAWLDEPGRRIWMWRGDTVERLWYVKIGEAVRSHENPILCLLDAIHCNTACYSGFDSGSDVIDLMNDLDEVVVKSQMLEVNVDWTCAGGGRVRVKHRHGECVIAHKNLLMAFYHTMIPF